MGEKSTELSASHRVAGLQLKDIALKGLRVGTLSVGLPSGYCLRELEKLN